MTKKQMRAEIKELEQAKDYYFQKWNEAFQNSLRAAERVEALKKRLEETVAQVEEWKEKYLSQLYLNIRLGEKIANKEDNNND